MAGIAVTQDLIAQVDAMIDEAARAEILPRWRNLAPDQIREKNPGDLVTAADEGAERHLVAALEAAHPGSVAIGEETVAKDPRALDVLSSNKPVWVIDPVDGTSAFAAGNPRFSVIVTLIQNGAPRAAWVHAPALGWRAQAGAGLGAQLNGAPVALTTSDGIHDLSLHVPNPMYARGAGKGRLYALCVRARKVVISIGIGMDYLELLSGAASAVVFSTRNPWELPAGALLVSEAGGWVVDGRGEPIDVLATPERPFVAARTRATTQSILDVLTPAIEPQTG